VTFDLNKKNIIMEMKIIFSRIFKAALLLVLSTSLSLGQNELMLSGKKKTKREYHCRHVGLQKVGSRKFSKEETEEYAKRHKIKKHSKSIEFAKADSQIKESTIIESVVIEKEEIVVDNILPLPKPVYFRFDTDELTHEDIHQIILAIEHVKLGRNIILEGHTDSHGTNHYNMALSLKRANKIKKMMIELGGVNESSVSVKNFGEERPATLNDNHQNRQLNRRVEFVVF
jgi:outer membrane protein OmpA-like peptidoglycan-associated protein